MRQRLLAYESAVAVSLLGGRVGVFLVACHHEVGRCHDVGIDYDCVALPCYGVVAVDYRCAVYAFERQRGQALRCAVGAVVEETARAYHHLVALPLALIARVADFLVSVAVWVSCQVAYDVSYCICKRVCHFFKSLCH